MKLRLCLFLLLLTLNASAEQTLEKTSPWLGKRVVFLGESHRSELDHQGQLQALQSLANESSQPLLLVAEMFNETGRPALESRATQTEFQDYSTEFWEDQWGHPYELYRPIFEWSETQGHHLTDLRPDPKRAKLLKERGVASMIPLLGEFFLGPAAYRQSMAEVAAEHLPPDYPLSSEMVDKYFLVQCFWDEYMSWRVAQLAASRPDQTLVVLVGHGHLHPEFGIPARLKRRNPELTTLTVGFDRENSWPADLWWDFEETEPSSEEL